MEYQSLVSRIYHICANMQLVLQNNHYKYKCIFEARSRYYLIKVLQATEVLAFEFAKGPAARKDVE
jgi:hypothetical protein